MTHQTTDLDQNRSKPVQNGPDPPKMGFLDQKRGVPPHGSMDLIDLTTRSTDLTIRSVQIGPLIIKMIDGSTTRSPFLSKNVQKRQKPSKKGVLENPKKGVQKPEKRPKTVKNGQKRGFWTPFLEGPVPQGFIPGR